MVEIKLILEGDGSAGDLDARGMECIHIGNDAEPMRIAYLRNGMESRETIVGINIPAG